MSRNAQRDRELRDARTKRVLRDQAIQRSIAASVSEPVRQARIASFAEVSAICDRGMTDDERLAAESILATPPACVQGSLI